MNRTQNRQKQRKNHAQNRRQNYRNNHTKQEISKERITYKTGHRITRRITQNRRQNYRNNHTKQETEIIIDKSVNYRQRSSHEPMNRCQFLPSADVTSVGLAVSPGPVPSGVLSCRIPVISIGQFSPSTFEMAVHELRSNGSGMKCVLCYQSSIVDDGTTVLLEMLD